MIEVTRTERGWGGHFICAPDCQFRRNTLLELGDLRIVVSTVGNLRPVHNGRKIDTIGHERYFETMVFHAHKEGPYWDANVMRGQIDFGSGWAISEIHEGVDNEANNMHEDVCAEIHQRMVDGDEFDTTE